MSWVGGVFGYPRTHIPRSVGPVVQRTPHTPGARARQGENGEPGGNGAVGVRGIPLRVKNSTRTPEGVEVVREPERRGVGPGGARGGGSVRPSAVVTASMSQSPDEHSEDLSRQSRPTRLLQHDLDSRDRLVAEFFDNLQRKPPNAWTTGGAVHRTHAPAYFQYPAMMSPVVQRDLLAMIRKVAPEVNSVLDPFAGSGTVLSEAMYAGLDCYASDLNPLALLLCRVKAGPYQPDALRSRIAEVLQRAKADKSRAVETKLRDHSKWFRSRAVTELSRLRRSIRLVADKSQRRFLWACLAETVRRTSNSRTSTYKLHIRAPGTLDSVDWPQEVFESVAIANAEKHREVKEHLAARGLLAGGHYTGRLTTRLQDATNLPRDLQCDLLMTSPPYGDNVSTVPYGQNSYLPLNWIDLEDICNGVQDDILVSTHEIDRRSLGGARPRIRDLESLQYLLDESEALGRTIAQLTNLPPDRRARVLGFIRDLRATLPTLARAVRPNGYMLWTVGQRRVGGVEIPLAQILTDELRAHNMVFLAQCMRTLPQKRMALRNSTSPTMRREYLIAFRRQVTGASNA